MTFANQRYQSTGSDNARAYTLVLTAFICIISVFVFIFSLGSIRRSDQVEASSYYGSDQVIVKVNQEREKQDIEPLLVNSKLMKAAQKKSDHMAKHSYFSHIDSTTEKRWLDFIIDVDYNYLEAGENLANGYNTVEDMVEAWMNSPTHRENILNEGYFETGVGYSRGKLNGRDTIFVTQMFGRTTEKRQNVKNTTTQEPAKTPDEYEESSLIDLWQKQDTENK